MQEAEGRSGLLVNLRMGERRVGKGELWNSDLGSGSGMRILLGGGRASIKIQTRNQYPRDIQKSDPC